MPPRKTPRIINFVHGGTTYQLPIDGEIQIRAVNDSPPFVPTTGEQSAKSRQYHNTLSIKKIRDDFGAQVDLDFESRGGVLDILSDSTMDTRWGPIWMAPKENNPTAPSTSGLSIVCRPTTPSGLPETRTEPNSNPKWPKYFQGTSSSGVFFLEVDTDEASNYEVDLVRWTGTAFATPIGLFGGTSVAANSTGGMDLEEFQGSLCALVNKFGTEQVYYTTDGDATTAFSNQPSVNAVRGSRLKAMSGLLWMFANVDGAITVQEQTSPTGGAAWTTRGGAASLSGQLRDVDTFFDLSETQRIVVLTESGLYYWDESNYEFNLLRTLPLGGRALLPVRIANAPAMLIFMDSMQVWAYFSDGTIWDVSPGGRQGMPSGKDFGSDANNQVCVTATGSYAYALWSGADTGGSVLNPLILALDTASVRVVEGRVEAGWKFIWRKADTSISSAASYIFIDPTSGDLLAGIQDAVSENTTHVRLKDIEVNPDLQATLDRQTAGIITTPRLDFGVPVVPTTVWDIFNHTNGLEANETITKAYRIDGGTDGYSEIAEVAADNTLTTLASGAGVNARDFQFQFTYATNAVTDVAKTFDIDIGYAKLWPVRLMYSFNVRTDFNISGGRSAQQIRLDITTIMGVQTKGTLNLGGDAASDSATVIPIPETTASEIIGNLSDPNGTKRAGTWTLHMLEA
jgi:hypothetical protein